VTASLDAARYDAVTFDCYGTLIDWESGLLAVLRPLLLRHDVHTVDDYILGFFGAAESRHERGAYRPYREVLGAVLEDFGQRLAFTVTAEQRLDFAQSVGDWPPFPDTVPALRRLGERFLLAVVSNVDDELFDLTRARLGVAFDHVVTAEQVRAYKPDRKPFLEAIARLGVPKERVLHVAQSRFHDIAPATALGLDTVWIDRRQGRGGGATAEADVAPTWTFTSLESLTAALLPA
jgi:2-haloacid dehalogenase